MKNKIGLVFDMIRHMLSSQTRKRKHQFFFEKCHEKVKIMNADGQEYADNFSRFIIIGGGISGLSAANTLVQRGIKDFK